MHERTGAPQADGSVLGKETTGFCQGTLTVSHIGITLAHKVMTKSKLRIHDLQEIENILK